MFDNIFNDKAIKELAGILAEQEAKRTAREILKEMPKWTKEMDEKLKCDIEKIIKAAS
jgi:polyhydroxyalkanoate synthesis regulator phasin